MLDVKNGSHTTSHNTVLDSEVDTAMKTGAK